MGCRPGIGSITKANQGVVPKLWRKAIDGETDAPATSPGGKR